MIIRGKRKRAAAEEDDNMVGGLHTANNSANTKVYCIVFRKPSHLAQSVGVNKPERIEL